MASLKTTSWLNSHSGDIIFMALLPESLLDDFKSGHQLVHLGCLQRILCFAVVVEVEGHLHISCPRPGLPSLYYKVLISKYCKNNKYFFGNWNLLFRQVV